MRDSISTEMLAAVRGKILEKANRSNCVMKLVEVHTGDGKTYMAHRLVNPNNDMEIPEAAIPKAELNRLRELDKKLLANGPGSTDRDIEKYAQAQENDPGSDEPETKPKSEAKQKSEKPQGQLSDEELAKKQKEREAGRKAKGRELAATKSANLGMSDDEFLDMYHSEDPRVQTKFKTAAAHKLLALANAQKKSFYQFSSLRDDAQELRDIANDAFISLVSPRVRKKRANKGKSLSDLDLFEMARDRARSEGKDEPNLQSYMLMTVRNKFLNAIKESNAYAAMHSREKTAGGEDDNNYSADQVYGASADEDAESKMESSESLGRKRQWLGDAIRSMEPEVAAYTILSTLKDIPDEEIGEKTGWSPTQMRHLREQMLTKLREHGDVKRTGGTGKGATYSARPDFLKAIEEHYYNLEKASFLESLE